jgi:acyl dehydratase
MDRSWRKADVSSSPKSVGNDSGSDWSRDFFRNLPWSGFVETWGQAELDRAFLVSSTAKFKLPRYGRHCEVNMMAPIDWFDDLTIGMRFKSDEVQITDSDIKRFASEFDPQPMHLDEDAAAKTLFKGLAASGWHTAAIAMNLAVQIRPFGPHPLIGMGVDGLRWTVPVRPNDVLHLEGEVVSLSPSKTKPQGVALVKWTMYNQNGEEVYTFTPIAIVPRRPQD